MAEEKKVLRCSFCGKAEGQVHRMIQGPGVRICDECVQLCMSILDDGYSAAMDESFESVEDLPTPQQIKEVLDQYVIGQVRRGPRSPCPCRCTTTISASISAATRMWSCRRATF